MPAHRRPPVTILLAACLMAGPALPADPPARPAVLFLGGAHVRYVCRPLHAMGIELGTCKAGELAARLAGGKFNVVVAGTMNDADRKAADALLAKGGGLFVCNPHAWSETKNWTATNQWLVRHGARPRWEVLLDTDPNNVVTDVMRCRHSFSDRIAEPFNRGARGVLTLLWAGTGGCEPPMSFDLTGDWKPVVRGAASLKSRPSKRHDEFLQPWKPREAHPGGPALLAVRNVGLGRLAVFAVRYYWAFTPPSNCPTAEAMLSAGAGAKPSDWLAVCANVFRWLAEPSRKAGRGGATTPDELLNPPVKVWPPQPPRDCTKPWALHDQPQTPGLIGARTALSGGAGDVADYVRAAKAAGLKFVVFLEDALKMDAGSWPKLVAACEAASDDGFAAVPGLTYEDAQGNHLYAFADEVKFPQPKMLLADKRLATVQSIRTRALFDYVNEYMRQKIISGYWRHADNVLHFADYKLYNSFPIVSHVDGRRVDDALDAYRYLMGLGGCQAALAFEIVTSPKHLAERARDGWRVVAHRPPAELRGKWHHGAWSFSGSGSQYVTNGPKILAWAAPGRLTFGRGQWWRSDLWQWRVGIRAASDVGLKSVTIHDGDRGVFRRWLPGGAKTFEARVVLSNVQQLGLFPVVEDVRGRRAVGMQFWNRNLIMEEFFCSDRCNFLGNCRLRTKAGGQVWTQVSFKGNMGITPSKGRLDLSVEPAVCLTLDSPTLPIDGRPMGFPTARLWFGVCPPGERKHLFAYPRTYMVGPEIAVGQADYLLAYDPNEQGAKATRLGHAYQQPQHGWGNSWGGWHRLVPTRVLSGFSRTCACNWLPGRFRIGWHETSAPLKRPVELPAGGLEVMRSGMGGWVVYRGEKPVASAAAPGSGAFGRGTFAILAHAGGSAVVAPLDGPLTFHCGKGGRLAVRYAPEGRSLAKGHRLRFSVGFAGAGSGTKTAELLDFARKFGLAEPARCGYAPKITRGTQRDNCLLWRLDAGGSAVLARAGRADMPGFVPAAVEGLNDNWSAFLVDRNRRGPNFRALPIRDGRAFAQIDLTDADVELFLGHPVTCDRPEVKVQVAWEQPGRWFVEAHNPGAETVRAKLRTTVGWGKFAFRESVELPAGTSRTWHVPELPRSPK